MRITCNHPASKLGLPVIIDDYGSITDYALGIRRLRRQLKLSAEGFGMLCGVSGRTVEGWEQGRHQPSARALNALSPYAHVPKTSAAR